MHDQPTVNVRPADAPRSGEWVVEWWSPLIAGPSYLYFRTEEKAQEAATRIVQSDRGQGQASLDNSVSPTPVPASPMEEVLHWGQRLLQELPADACGEAARGLRLALERLEEEGGF